MTTTACLPECERNCWTGQDKHAFGCPVAVMFGSAEQAYFGPRAPLTEAQKDLTKIQCNCGRSPLHPVSAHVPAPQAEDGGKVGRKVCQKIPHSAGGGYMHDEEHDGPYDVDGVLYCGRCHSWYNNPADHGAPALSEQPRTAAGDGDSNCPEDLCDGVQHWFGDQPFSCPNVCLCADKPGPHTHSPSGSIEAERDALRAELAAAREEVAEMKTCRHEWGDPQTKDGAVKTCQLCGVGGTDCAAEKARADKAEQEYREIKAVLAVTRDDLAKAEQRVREYEELITGAPFGIPEAKRKILAARLDSRAAILREQKEGGR